MNNGGIFLRKIIYNRPKDTVIIHFSIFIIHFFKKRSRPVRHAGRLCWKVYHCRLAICGYFRSIGMGPWFKKEREKRERKKRERK